MDIKINYSVVEPELNMITLPRMFLAKQTFERPVIQPDEIYNHVIRGLEESGVSERVHSGMTIAITVGSRGIANQSTTVKAIVDDLKGKGAKPFIVPAMGSHGGGNAENQLHIVEAFGITEEAMGCPIKSSMETVCIGNNEEGVPVYLDKNAFEADGIVVNCRIKPHPAFRGVYESGIMKMMTIGLGKRKGADSCHNAGFGKMARNIYLFGRTILEKANILFAVASIENAYDETARIDVVKAEDVIEQEPGLLVYAEEHMARFLFESCDVLIVDRIGKEISGDGMDPNVMGRFGTKYATGGLQAERVVVLDLTEATHGNGLGCGHADIVTERLVEKLDLGAMYLNAMTSRVLQPVSIPVIMRNDRQALQMAIVSCAGIDREKPRVVRILDTLHMEYILLSEAFLDEVDRMEGIEAVTGLFELETDKNGNFYSGHQMREFHENHRRACTCV
jgi:hypothetical protein